jgi:hypothetical protein
MKATKTKVTSETIYEWHDGTVLSHQMSDEGLHRIVICCKPPQDAGEWAGYKGIARNGQFAATTEYFEGYLPRVFVVTPLIDCDTRRKAAKQCVARAARRDPVTGTFKHKRS